MPGIKTVLYLDELLLVNFVASALFLLASGLACGRRCAPLRLLAGAACGAAASLVILLPAWPGPAAAAYRAASAAAAVAAVYGWPGPRPFARLWAWFLGCNLLLGGAVLLPVGAHSRNFSVYLPLSPGRLLALCGGVYLGLRLALFCLGRTRPAVFDARLELGEASIPVQAFCDTGFHLTDPISGRAVVLLRTDAVRGQLPGALASFLEAYFTSGAPPPPGLGVRLIPCQTVAGPTLLPAVPARAVVRCAGGRTRRLPGPLAAFCGPGLPPDGWTMLLGAEAARELELL